jgi:hypothetical protein
MGMSLMKQVINEKGGYKAGQGQREDITGTELADLKASAVPFEELTLANSKDVKVTGIEAINGVEAYAVKKGETTLYYDVKTGYKVAEANQQDTPAGKIPVFTYFSDYKDVKGIKIPYKVVMNVGVDLDLTVSEVKINEGVTPADFQ